jgi:hypothetical protein
MRLAASRPWDGFVADSAPEGDGFELIYAIGSMEWLAEQNKSK